MSRLTPADEYFYHQIPEPLPAVLAPSEHWRESSSLSSTPAPVIAMRSS
ncbi:MAG: hypothetical protein IPI85_13520 [Dehalococcoidia bacterium]|nr:hypothetical protein [Dehalococcoidia bacterium]